MNVLFVHQNFPAQLGMLAMHLRRVRGFDCRFACKTGGEGSAIPIIRYKDEGPVSAQVHFLARNFESCARAAMGVYRAVRDSGFRPDLVIGHSGFGSTVLLKELFQCPVINLFEFYYQPHSDERAYRKEFPMEADYQRRLRVLNAAILSDLDAADAGYTPTHFQRNQFPHAYLPKIRMLFDGVDDALFRPMADGGRKIAGHELPTDRKIVTYVARGFESTRGYDIFIRAAKRIYEQYPEVLFVVVGSDRVCYGGDLRYIKQKTFKEHVEAVERPDPSKFLFTGLIATTELARLLAISDAHMYFTVPFVLSWSLFNALSSGCRVVSSATPPVREVIEHGYNGFLADFYDVEGHAENVLRVLRDAEGTRVVGVRARETIQARYSCARVIPQFERMISEVTGRSIG